MDNKVDFYVHGYQQVHIGGYTFWITTSHVCLVIVMVALIIFAIVANRVIKKADYRKAPTGFLNVIELLVETVDKLVLDNMGGKLAPRFRNYVGALFMLILTCNLSGLFGLRPPTADYGITLPLALITFVMIQYQGFKWQKMGKIKGLFEPIFVFLPVNIISEFATPVSMSLRLFGVDLRIIAKTCHTCVAGSTACVYGCIFRSIAGVCFRDADNGIYCQCSRGRSQVKENKIYLKHSYRT